MNFGTGPKKEKNARVRLNIAFLFNPGIKHFMNVFEEVERLLKQGDLDNALEQAAASFIESRDPHRLFEIRKMQGRKALNLPVVSWQPLELSDDSTQQQLEAGLLDACREVGVMLVELGDLPAAWNYLEPVPDREWVKTTMESMTIDSENLDRTIEVAFHRGAHPVWGIQLILQHHGTCNAITLFDSSAPYFSPVLRSQIAEALVVHFYDELAGNIANALDAPPDTVDWLSEMVESSEPRLFAKAPHIDATHLHSITRIGLLTESAEHWARLKTLCRYGQQLPDLFQFPGEAPFESHFEDLLKYYEGLLGEHTDQAIRHFEGKLQAHATQPTSNVTVETVVNWLARIGRLEDAIETALRFGNDRFGELGIAPNLIELASRAPNLASKLEPGFREQGDLLSFLMTQILEQMPHLASSRKGANNKKEGRADEPARPS